MAMTREIYEAMKSRITAADAQDRKEYLLQYPNTRDGAFIYHFHSDGLNGNENYDYLFDIICAFSTNNIWDVARAFYKVLKDYTMSIDERLLAK